MWTFLARIDFQTSLHTYGPHLLQ